MLSNITSYLFGGQTSNAGSEKENINFHEVEEDDWMVIDKLAEMSKSVDGDDLIVSSETFISVAPTIRDKQSGRPPVPDSKSSRRRSISCKRLVNRRCSTPLRELSPACINTKAVVPYVPKKESRSSSKSSQTGMEESWYLTPPPCFVSGPYETKPSSLENLLIEQPGVHFVSKRRQQQQRDEKPRLSKEEVLKLKSPKELPASKIQDSNNNNNNNNNSNINNNKKMCSASSNNAIVAFRLFEENKKRQHLLELHEQKKFINTCQSQIIAAQKGEQKLSGQFIKRNQMERMNKVQHELSSRKKRQRRADLTNKKHSGVNNNRKCCY